MCIEACEGRRSLGIQEEAIRSRDTISFSSFSSKQVSNLLSKFLDLLLIILWDFWCKKHDLWEMDVPSKYNIRFGTMEGFHGIKVQTLWPLKPHASYRMSFWPFKLQKAMHGEKGGDFTCSFCL